MKERKLIFAAFAIVLLMSAAPLQASRVNSKFEDSQQHAIGGGSQAKFPFGASCDTLQENFLRLRGESSAALTKMHNGETLSFTAKVALAMKMRGMLRTVRRATSNECGWVSDNNVLDFQTQLAEAAAMNPCFSTAQELIESANGIEDEQEQHEIYREAAQIMMSPTCELPEDDDDGDGEDDGEEEEEEADDEDAFSEVNQENTQEEDEILEEVDEIAEELADTALADPNGASLVQEDEGQFELVIVGAFMTFFFALFFLIWLPFIAGAACFVTGLGFLVFSLLGCLLYNLMRLLLGRVPGGCPMFNWLPHCPQVFNVLIESIWGDGIANGGAYSYNSYGGVAPGVVVTANVYYDRRRRFLLGRRGSTPWSARRPAVRRANRQARRVNRRVRRGGGRRMGGRRGRR